MTLSITHHGPWPPKDRSVFYSVPWHPDFSPLPPGVVQCALSASEQKSLNWLSRPPHLYKTV